MSDRDELAAVLFNDGIDQGYAWELAGVILDAGWRPPAVTDYAEAARRADNRTVDAAPETLGDRYLGSLTFTRPSEGGIVADMERAKAVIDAAYRCECSRCTGR